MVVETFDIPCRGNNGLKIIDTSRNNRIESVNFCSKQRDSKVPMFVSTEVSFDLLLTIDSPLPVSSRTFYITKQTDIEMLDPINCIVLSDRSHLAVISYTLYDVRIAYV